MLEQEQVVLVAQDSVFDEERETARVGAQFVEHAVGVGGDLRVDRDDDGSVPQGWGGERALCIVAPDQRQAGRRRQNEKRLVGGLRSHIGDRATTM